MSCFAAVRTRRGEHRSGEQADLGDCESVADLGDVLRDRPGQIRLPVIEQDVEDLHG